MYIHNQSKRLGDKNMAYTNDKFDIKPIYAKNWETIFMEFYQDIYNMMKGLYTGDEKALAAACNTAMIAFCDASGMNMPGAISLDEESASGVEDFKTFLEVKKSTSGGSSYTPAYSGGAPASGGKSWGNKEEKKDFTGVELKGGISAKQIEQIDKFLNDRNKAVVAATQEFLEAHQVEELGKMSKQDASQLIGLVFGMRKNKN
jgi:hypothetical protein